MMSKMLEVQAEVIQALTGKPCWYASCGGAVGSTFELTFGAKIPRRDVVQNDLHSEEFRRFEGESNLFVWCSWRLDDSTRPLSSSDDTKEHINDALNRVVGTVVTDVRIEMPGWDLHVGFSNGLTLRVFCDHLPGDPTFSDNWELCLRDKYIVVGLGSVFGIEARPTPASA